MVKESGMGVGVGVGGMVGGRRESEDGGVGLDEMVRVEVMRGCELVQEMEEKMKAVPVGWLRLGGGCRENEVVRASLVGAAAAIVSSFSNVITLFNPRMGSSAREEERKLHLNPRRDSSRPILSPVKICDSPTSETPPPSPLPMKKLEISLRSSPTLCSTPTPPQSTPSPQQRVRDLASLHKLSKSDGSADPPTHLDLNDANAKELTSVQARAESKTQNLETENSNSKRRKCMPKWTVKIPGSNTSEQGNEAAPEDDYTWRKYGQKDILGSRHPRSYYRCTHKRETGCPAIKYVQKSDDDRNSRLFHVTYKGAHTCTNGSQSTAYSIIPARPLQDLTANLQLNSSCLTLSSNGSLQVGQSGPTFSTSDPFVSSPLLSKSSGNGSGKSLSFKPISSFPVSQFAHAPRFGTENYFSSLQFQPKNCVAAVNPGRGEDSLMIDAFDPSKVNTLSKAKTSQIKRSNSAMLTPGINIIPISEADKTHNLARIYSPSISRTKRESFKQLIDHLCLDDLQNSACPPENFSPTISEVLSPPFPMEDHLQRSPSPQSNPLAALATAGLEDLQADAKPETLEEVAEHIPSCEFEVDFILDSGSSQQQLLDLECVLFEA